MASPSEKDASEYGDFQGEPVTFFRAPLLRLTENPQIGVPAESERNFTVRTPILTLLP
jgi:hypothetical protein